MQSYYTDKYVTIYNGNSMEVLKTLPDNSIQCCVTSPPYWGLRKYDGEQDYIWGGNEYCEHEWGLQLTGKQTGGDISKYWKSGGIKDFDHVEVSQGNFCQLCGAWKGAYGLEPTPEMYVDHTILFLNEIKRVLRKDGVCFWNLGDSYFASGNGSNDYRLDGASISKNDNKYQGQKPGRKHNTLKPKDLCLIPFHVAIAAQESGWWVRSVIIWSKPNPMPESVQDRPTDSHEYILMLTKSSKYYWDIEAVREPDHPDNRKQTIRRQTDRYNGEFLSSFQDQEHERWTGSRNIRTVWEFPTQPYKEAHFAVFPEELPRRCIMAASKEGDTILDPFSGSGTTGMVAKKYGRKAVLIESSGKYCKLIDKRVSEVPIPMELGI